MGGVTKFKLVIPSDVSENYETKRVDVSDKHGLGYVILLTRQRAK